MIELRVDLPSLILPRYLNIQSIYSIWNNLIFHSVGINEVINNDWFHKVPNSKKIWFIYFFSVQFDAGGDGSDVRDRRWRLRCDGALLGLPLRSQIATQNHHFSRSLIRRSRIHSCRTGTLHPFRNVTPLLSFSLFLLLLLLDWIT